LQQVQLSPQQHVAWAFSQQQHFAVESGAAKLLIAIAQTVTKIGMMRFIVVSPLVDI
jgi:hypothetical protein